MKKEQKVMVGLAAAGLLGFIVYSTVQQSAQKYEVCVSYQGRSHCAAAAGRTQEEAIAAGQQIGCALITNGRDENMACLGNKPTSVKKLQ